jgi:signal transduction histidine kinase
MQEQSENEIGVELSSLMNKGDFKQAIESAKNYFEKTDVKNLKLRFNLLRIIGAANFYLSDFNEAEKWFSFLVNDLESIKDAYQLASAQVGLGGCCYHNNKIKEAEELFLKAKKNYELCEDTRDLCFVYNWLGIVYGEQNKIFLALEMNIKALSVAKECNNNPIIESSLNSIGLQFFELNDYDKAITYFEEALELVINSHNLIIEADVRNNLGMTYRKKKEYEKSIAYFKDALMIRREHFVHDFKRIGHNLNNLASSESDLGQLDSAKKHFHEAMAEYSKLPYNIDFRQSIVCQLAEIELKQNNLTEASNLLVEYKDNVEKFNERSYDGLYYKTLSQYYAFINDYKQALEAYTQYAGIKEAEAEKSANSILENMEIRFEYERKKSEAEIFRLRNEELAHANETKDRLLTVIAHDLRGPLANVIEVLKLLSIDRELISPIDQEIIIHELLDDTQNAYELLQNLLSWARTQMETISLNKEHFSVIEVINETLYQSHTLISKKEILCETMVDDKAKVYADRNMISFILRNFISNAVKFTSKKGIITISSSIDDQFVHISVQDNGIGISSEKLEHLFQFSADKSTRGTDNEKGTGLGLILCKDFAELNNGILKVVSTEEQGSTFTISIPHNKGESSVKS